MRDEPDLYPPDLEVVTPDRRHARDRAMVGTFLVTLGSGLLLERVLDNNLDVFWLAVGLALLAGWAQAPRILMFIWGAILTGFAVGGLLKSLDVLPFDTAISLLCAAAGFFAVYVRYPHRAKWALVPAGITLLFAVLATGVELIGLIPSVVTSAGLPLLLILGGGLLLFRNALPGKVVRIGLVVIAVLFVSSAASSIDEWDGGPDVDFPGPFETREASLALPDLAGRTLVLDADDAHVELRMDDTEPPQVRARTNGPPRHLEIDESDDEVAIEIRQFGPRFGNRDVESWQVVVPAGTDVRITTDAGLVNATVDGGNVEIETDEGQVLSTLAGDAGTLTVTTDEGLVQVNGGNRSISLTAESDDGSILVDGRPRPNPYELAGGEPRVDVTTDEGQIIVVDLAS